MFSGEVRAGGQGPVVLAAPCPACPLTVSGMPPPRPFSPRPPGGEDRPARLAAWPTLGSHRMQGSPESSHGPCVVHEGGQQQGTSLLSGRPGDGVPHTQERSFCNEGGTPRACDLPTPAPAQHALENWVCRSCPPAPPALTGRPGSTWPEGTEPWEACAVLSAWQCPHRAATP